MRKLIAAAVGALALIMGGAAPALADHEGVVYAESPWAALDTGPAPWTPDTPSVPSELSEIVDTFTADLTWAAGTPASELGTSLETENLGLHVGPFTQFSVNYELQDGASAASGAVRLFVTVDGVTLAAPAPADATSGTLTVVAPAGGEVSYSGLVYDTSNGGVPGTVRFTDLTVSSGPALEDAKTGWSKKIAFTAAPTPDAPGVVNPTCEAPQAAIVIPESEHFDYYLEGSLVEAGSHPVDAPGTYSVEAYWAGHGPAEVTSATGDHPKPPEPVTSWELDVSAPPTDCEPGGEDGTDDGTEDGTDDGSEEGSEDGTDDGTEEGSEEGSEDGTETGTEDGSEEGSEEGSETGTDDGTDGGTEVGSEAGDDDGTPTPTPTEPPTDGGDDGTEDGDDDQLPDTGSNPLLMGVGVSLALLGGLVAFVSYRRRQGGPVI